MTKKWLLIGSCLFSTSLIAQIPEDLTKYSWQPVNGTARANAIGGAMGALGGDLSATFTNPAGLAFYRTSDFVLSPGLSSLKNKSAYRGSTLSGKDKSFNVGTSGLVFGIPGGRTWTNKAFSLAVTRTADFRSKIYYSGLNDFSSQAEQYAAEAAASGVDLNFMPTSNLVSYGTRLAAYNYVIDAATIPGNPGQDVISMSMWDALTQGGDFLVRQSHAIETTGGITEAALGYAANMDDKVYVGGSIGIPIVHYKKESIFIEEDETGNTDNNFAYNILNERFTTKGVGINGKFGVIIKPSSVVRLGLSVHTPTWYTFEDRYTGSMTTDLEAYRSTPGALTVTMNDILNNGESPSYKYEVITPWKIALSGSYVLNQVEDVRQQKGFLTADIEYVTHKSNRFRNAEDYDDGGYYDALNDVVKDYYKNAINFRLGGELKFTTVMARLGFAYYGSPYKDKELKANKTFLTGGLGYRNAGMFIDVSYAYRLQKDVSFPYRLPDKANTFADVRGRGGNLMLTIGFKI